MVLQKLNTLDKKFDPNLHQAMMEVENDDLDEGIVVQEIQSGYMMHDRLLRPAMVGVSKKSQQKPDIETVLTEIKDLIILLIVKKKPLKTKKILIITIYLKPTSCIFKLSYHILYSLYINGKKYNKNRTKLLWQKL